MTFASASQAAFTSVGEMLPCAPSLDAAQSLIDFLSMTVQRIAAVEDAVSVSSHGADVTGAGAYWVCVVLGEVWRVRFAVSWFVWARVSWLTVCVCVRVCA